MTNTGYLAFEIPGRPKADGVVRCPGWDMVDTLFPGGGARCESSVGPPDALAGGPAFLMSVQRALSSEFYAAILTAVRLFGVSFGFQMAPGCDKGQS